MTKDTVLVVGATGLLGGLVCKHAQPHYDVRAMVRPSSRSKAEMLAREGAEVTFGDLKDGASLSTACQGVRVVISTATAIASPHPSDSIETVDMAGQLALIDAAESAGVERFVFVSFPEQPETFPLQSAKRAVEERLRRSHLRYVILRPTLFQEVWLSPALGFDGAEGRVRLYGTGEPKLSWISVADVASAMVAAADDGAGQREVWDLGGPEALSPNEVVKIFEGVAEREFAVERVPVEVLRAQFAAATDPRQKSFFGLTLEYSRGRVVGAAERKEVSPSKGRVEDYALNVVKGKRSSG